MKIPDIPLIDVFGRGGALKSSWYGDCLPIRDFPMLVDLYQQGRLDLDAFVTEEIGIGDVEAAFDEDARRRRAALGGGLLMTAAGRPRASPAARSRLDGETFDVDNNVWVVGDDDECVVIDAPARRRRRSSPWSATAGCKAIVLHPRPRRPRPGRAGAARGGDRADPAAPRRPAAVGAHPPRPPLGRRPRRRPGDRRSPARRCTVLHTPGHAPGRGLPLRARPRLRVHRRHPVPGRARARPAAPTATAT